MGSTIAETELKLNNLKFNVNWNRAEILEILDCRMNLYLPVSIFPVLKSIFEVIMLIAGWNYELVEIERPTPKQTDLYAEPIKVRGSRRRRSPC